MELKHFNGGGLREMKNDGMNIFKGRLFMFFASLLILSVSGTSFMFALWAHIASAKTFLGYDQTTFNLLSFFKDVGANFGFLSWLISDMIPPWMVLLIASFMNFFSYFMAWLAFTGRTGKPHVWQMCAYICLGANSQTLFTGGAISPSVKNFPEFKPIVSGTLKACLGLTSGIMTQLDYAFSGGDSQFSLILVMACLPAIVSLVFMPSVRLIQIVHQSREIRSVLYKMLFLSFALAGSIMALIILQHLLMFNRIEYDGGACLVITLLFFPLAVVVRDENRALKLTKQSSDNVSQMISAEVTVVSVQLAPPTTVVVESLPAAEVVLTDDEEHQSNSILQAIFSINMLIILITIICSFAGTLTAVDNMGQIGKALGYPWQTICTIISLVSIWNYLGRFFAGFGSEYCLNKHRLSRPLILAFVNLFCCVGHLLIALGIPNSLYFSSAIIGFCFGAQLPLMDAIISDFFGLKYSSTLCSFASMATLLGSYMLKVRVVGNLYDKEGLKQMKALDITRKAGEELICRGSECFRMAFIIILATSLFGSMVSCILVVRTWKLYRSLAAKKGETNGQCTC